MAVTAALPPDRVRAVAIHAAADSILGVAPVVFPAGQVDPAVAVAGPVFLAGPVARVVAVAVVVDSAARMVAKAKAALLAGDLASAVKSLPSVTIRQNQS